MKLPLRCRRQPKAVVVPTDVALLCNERAAARALHCSRKSAVLSYGPNVCHRCQQPVYLKTAVARMLYSLRMNAHNHLL